MTHKLLLTCLCLLFLSTSLVSAQGDADLGDTDLPLPVGGHVLTFDADTASAMQTAAMTWVTQTFYFRSGADLTAISDFINDGHQAGFKVLLNITGSSADMDALGDEYVPAFAAFLGEVAALGADGIEVWNEMNIDRAWPAGQVNGANYVRLLAESYNAIKAANPDTLVITGALNPTGFYGAAGCTAQGCNDDVYAQQMAEAGAADFADCVGVHYFEGAVSPAQTKGDPGGDYPTRYFPTMIERMAAPFEGQDIPLCFTGLGYLSAEGYEASWPEYLAWGKDTSVTEQAKWLRDAILVARDDGRVALLIVSYVDRPSGDEGYFGGSAIIRADNTCPACQAIGSLANLPLPEPIAAVTAGDEVTATISAATSAVAFTIVPGDQAQIGIQVGPAGGSALDPVLVVYDNGGSVIAFNDDGSPSSLSAYSGPLPGDQELTAVVYAFNEASTGDFSLSVGSGEATLESSPLLGTIAGSSNVNIRSGPGATFEIVAVAAPGTEIALRGRNADGSWLAVTVEGVEGWVAAFLVSTTEDTGSLPILE
ncbi:MAG: SH3 domain-containing protein [Anaerolineae bacterium]|nr:SH3 domain-containing protein [Anaerolineae bacterium]